jgi:hypothetical protein|tara:strand:- start:668 stop:1333 length:666 start_codon:yes stop_codon:yes gene_type:complete
VALTKYNYNSFDLTTAASKGLAFNSSANGFETASEGSMVLIKTLTASSSSTLSFVDGSSSVVFDNTYPVYMFKLIGLHPSASDAQTQFQVSTNTGSSYGVTITSNSFEAGHNGEGDDSSVLQYAGNDDLIQSTSFQPLTNTQYHGTADEAMSGTLHIFNPASTTFVKQFMSTCNRINNNNLGHHRHGGIINTTSAVDAIQFKFSAGNIDSGTIKMYGIKDS